MNADSMQIKSAQLSVYNIHLTLYTHEPYFPLLLQNANAIVKGIDLKKLKQQHERYEELSHWTLDGGSEAKSKQPH